MPASDVVVEVEQVKGGDLLIKFNSETMSDMVIRRVGVSRERIGGEARMLLAASVGECICSALTSALDIVKLEYDRINAAITVNVKEDEANMLYIKNIDINMRIKAPKDEGSIEKFKRAKILLNRILRRGSLISRSMEKGIKINYEVEME
ncbi:MAG TPA: hypothetical protein ENF33_04065 [Nitrososphaeria archaeon]|nr:hypothetical protein [Nitrososphaeria archaeon]